MRRAQMNPRNLPCTPVPLPAFHSLVRETPRGRLTSTAPHRGSSSRNSNITLGTWGSRKPGFGVQLSRRAAGSCAGSPLGCCWGNQGEAGQSYSTCKNPNLGRGPQGCPGERSLTLFKSMAGGEGSTWGACEPQFPPTEQAGNTDPTVHTLQPPTRGN